MNLEDQNSFKRKILPILKKEGVLFEKVKAVFAKKAHGGEHILTITQDGLETSNTANKGDFIIKNQTKAGEQYIISAEKFRKKYQLLQKRADGFHEYSPLGKILAIEVTPTLLKELDYAQEFHFQASWGEAMVVKKGDFLATSLDFESVYRIARKEFFETYREKK